MITKKCLFFFIVGHMVLGRPAVFVWSYARDGRFADELNPLKPYYSFKSVRDKRVRYKTSSATAISRRGAKQAREGREASEGAALESYQGGDWTNDTVSKFPRSVEWRKRASPSKSVRQLILQGRKRKQKVNSPACIPGSIVATMGFISPLVVRPTCSASLATAYNVHRQYKLSDAFS